MPLPLSLADHAPQGWQQQLADSFNNINDLCEYLGLSVEKLPLSASAAKQFPLKVTKSFADCMQKGDPHDPLLLQVLPVADETLLLPGFSYDPVGDLPATTDAGVLHKYHGRVLLINTGACAIHCRYCFRRNFPYAELQLGKQKQDQALHYIQEHDTISEVILSGGDPLLLNDGRLADLLTELNHIPHLKRIRIHSRIPIVLPGRITKPLLTTFAQSRKQLVMVLHCNHANEISAEVGLACAQLKKSGLQLLNQSVLLKRVNDDVNVLTTLSETLFANGILPYYLHQLDKAHGTGHFEVPEPRALQLLSELQACLPGYLVPKLVKEVAGADAKQLMSW